MALEYFAASSERPVHAAQIEHSIIAGLIALAAGAVALIAPPAALLVLAALAARALMRAEFATFNLLALAPPLGAAAIVGALFGWANAIGFVFAWRLFAEARWSIHEAQRLARVAARPAEADTRALWHAWATPAYGLALVAYTAPHMIAGLPLDLPHVPFWVPALAGAAAVAGLFDWALRRLVDWRLGELAPAPAAHLLTHHAVFLLCFGFTLDVSAGIVALMAWRLASAAPLGARVFGPAQA